MGPVGQQKFVINRASLREWLNECGLNRKDLIRHVGLEYEAFNKRLHQAYEWTLDEVKRICEFIGEECTPADIANPITAINVPRAATRGASRRATKFLPLNGEDIKSLYRDMGAGDFVCVFSMDGFLERGNAAFYKDVEGAVRRGLELIYLFPDTDLAQESISDFELISEKMRKELGLAFYERVKAFFVDAANSYVCTRATRFVFFGSVGTDGGRTTHRVMLYIASRGDHWVDLSIEEHLDFLAELDEAIDPVPYRPVSVWGSSWRLPETIRSHYQQGFQSDTYLLLRDILESRETAERIAEKACSHLAEAEFDRENSVLRWLDIGCETGANTRAMFNCLKGHGYKVALTGIDPSPQYPERIDEVLRLSPFFNGPRWTFEEFCRLAPKQRKFDLITSLHSWYVIDPIYLLEAYRRLSERGLLAVCLGPYGLEPSGQGNFVNCITGVADGLIEHDGGRFARHDTYATKVIREDPYRNFAEDLESALTHFFGIAGEDFYVDFVPKEVPAAAIMNGAGLTPNGEALAQFFTHGLIRDSKKRDLLFSSVYDALCRISNNGKLPANEFDFFVDRDRITSRKKGDARFRPSS